MRSLALLLLLVTAAGAMPPAGPPLRGEPPPAGPPVFDERPWSVSRSADTGRYAPCRPWSGDGAFATREEAQREAERRNAALPSLTLPTRAPEVARPVRPFRGLARHGSHNCPACGRLVTAVSGRGPQPGTHVHACPCGQSWFH